MPRTPVSAGPLSWVRFDDRVVVTGEGEPALSEAGLAEAWYDPARPIRLQFRTLDGASSMIEGVLPFTHRMVVDGTEYRFSAVSTAPRFLEVTGRAPLPEAGDDSSASAEDTQTPRAAMPEPDALTE
jgi:hypothetical protein